MCIISDMFRIFYESIFMLRFIIDSKIERYLLFVFYYFIKLSPSVKKIVAKSDKSVTPRVLRTVFIFSIQG
jgi:hypothetical protein